MSRLIFAVAAVGAALSIYACSRAYIQPEALTPPVAAAQTVHYRQDVQPIFEQKCAACHACNDAPCQLKLTNWEGTERGASKLPVYNGTRKDDQAPTRLGIDAIRTSDWRKIGFFSALYAPENDEASLMESSLISRMIELGHAHPWEPNSKIPEHIELDRGRENVCPTIAEFDDYAEERPLQGMPLAVTGLTEQEYQTLSAWTAEGSVVEPSLLSPSPSEAKAIQTWEAFLNRDSKREQLVARYLFEHLFIAHLHFASEDKPNFYELVRSRTPPGQAVVPVATTRPNGQADGPVFYRFRLITETLVQKTHITYALSEEKLRRFESLFYADDWEVDQLPGYSKADRANAFATFAAIPARARYQFMLDDAEYFVRTFIRGPVCAGQIATDVIRDQFWVSFEDPETERYVNSADYRKKVTPLIGVPGQDSDLIDVAEQWDKYRDQRNRYMESRQAEYARAQPEGPGLDDLWDGDGSNRDALLTVFRHHDSAAVRRGLHGTLPESLWVMDYPLLERTYYNLVVNFNVFGSVSHQLQTRLYFDLIRNEGEYNFLRFMPPSAREKIRKSWYRGMGEVKLFTTYAKADDATPTRIAYQTDDPKAEFANKLFSHMSKITGPDDVLNRCGDGACDESGTPEALRPIHAALRELTGKTGAQLPVIPLLPELVYLRIEPSGEAPLIYALVHNRAHTNVAFLLGEELRFEPEKDTLTVMEGAIGSYPNFMFDVPSTEVADFVKALSSAEDAKALEAVVEQWGVRRTHPNFWALFHDLSRYVDRTQPIETGIFDMSRYANL